jgi:hypothetical protein
MGWGHEQCWHSLVCGSPCIVPLCNDFFHLCQKIKFKSKCILKNKTNSIIFLSFFSWNEQNERILLKFLFPSLLCKWCPIKIKLKQKNHIVNKKPIQSSNINITYATSPSVN